MIEFFKRPEFVNLTELSIVLRLLLAVISGGILGFERTRKMRAAGLRTYMLVCVGASMAMMAGQYLFSISGTGDPSRIAAQVVSGIGFIGAGTIMMTGYHRVKGLTTAAGLWLCGCMGIAIGCGFYFGAIMMLCITLLAIVAGDRFQTYYLSRSNKMRLYIMFDSPDSLKEFLIAMKNGDITVSDFDFIGNMGNGVSASFMLKIGPGYKHQQVLDRIYSMPGVAFVEEV